MKRSKALFSVAIGALCFSTLAILTQLAYRVGIKPLPLLAWRFFLAAIVITILAVQRNPQALKVPKRDLVRYLLLSWFGYGASSLAFFFALKHADSSVVSAILYAYPALVALGASVLFREPFSRQKGVSIALVAFGCVLVVGLFSSSHVHVDARGIILAFLSAVAYAAFNLMSQRWLPGRSSMTMMSFMFSFASVAFIALTCVVNGPHALVTAADWSLRSWLIMITIVVFPTVLAILLYMRGVRQLGASEAAIVSTLEPLFTVTFAWMFLAQKLTILQIGGVLFILVGVVLSALAKKAASPLPSAPLSDDEIAKRRLDWVGPNGETTPAYALPKKLRDKLTAPRKGAEHEAEEHEDAQKPPRSPGEWALRIIIGLIIAFIVFQMIALVGIALFLRIPAPDISLKHIAERSSQTSIMYAADGTEIARFAGNENREPVRITSVAPKAIAATVAIEDRRFYEHGGVDLVSIMRALKRNTEEGVIKQGGSTITQQLIKMLYTNRERTLSRKVREAVLATRAEMVYSKDDILESYLNMAYYGQGAYGIESAARTYFNTTVDKLTIPQAATLAGLVRSPSAFNAFANPKPVKARRNLVLKAMWEHGDISTEEYTIARGQDLGIVRGAQPTDSIKYPYFVDYARREVVSQIGEEAFSHGGLKIYTTLDPLLQNQADATAATFSQPVDPEVSLVTVRQSTGEVLALVGGRDWTKNQYNLAVQGKRQPGSAFKPFTLMTALASGISPDEVYPTSNFSAPVKDGIWNVANFSTIASPQMTLRDATVHSVNTVYARLIMRVGPQKVADTVKKFGFSSQIDPNPAIALGGLKYGVSPLEMASAYAAIANNGVLAEPTPLVKIVDRDGRVIYQHKVKTEQAVSPQVAKATASVLGEVVTRGTGQGAQISEPAAGKTGTTQSYRDAWFCGWSHGVSTAVWMGYPAGQIEMTSVRGISVTGGSFPARLWSQYMQVAVKLRPQQGCLLQQASVSSQENMPQQPAHPPVVSAPEGGILIPDTDE